MEYNRSGLEPAETQGFSALQDIIRQPFLILQIACYVFTQAAGAREPVKYS